MFVLGATRYRSRFCAFADALKPRTRALPDRSPLSNGSSITAIDGRKPASGKAITVYSWPFAALVMLASLASVVVVLTAS